MTPLSKMVTVSLNTGVGECMELMRTHQIRHLPVMATETGEDRNQALQNLKSVAERGEASARKQFTPYKAKLKDAFGDDEGMQAFAALSADPDAPRLCDLQLGFSYPVCADPSCCSIRFPALFPQLR